MPNLNDIAEVFVKDIVTVSSSDTQNLIKNPIKSEDFDKQVDSFLARKLKYKKTILEIYNG